MNLFKPSKISPYLFIIVILLIYISSIYNSSSFAAPDVGQIQRSEEIIAEEKALRGNIEEEKVFIKEITINSDYSLSKEKIDEITALFENQPLAKEDLKILLDSIRELYIEEAGVKSPLVSYAIDNGTLIITISNNKN